MTMASTHTRAINMIRDMGFTIRTLCKFRDNQQQKAKMRVSVVVPCIPNHITHLAQLLQSIQKGTVLPSEIVIALSETDPQTASNTEVMLQAHTTVPLILASTPTQCYAAKNRNRGVHHCTGDIVSFIDADDLMHPARISIVTDVMQRHKADAVYHSFTRDAHYGDKLLQSTAELAPDAFRAMEAMDRTFIHLANPHVRDFHHGHVTVRRQVYLTIGGQKEDPAYRRREDAKFLRDLVQAGYRVAYTPEKLTIYREWLSAEPLVGAKILRALPTIGIVVAVILLTAIVLLLAYLGFRKRRSRGS